VRGVVGVRMLIDTHCHLDAAEFDADRAQVLAEAARAGTGGIVVPAVEVGNFDAVAALAHAHPWVGAPTTGLDASGVAPKCVYALGIHPMYVDRARDEDLQVLRARVEASIDDPALVAIGEIGLDHFVPGLDRARQERFLVEQLRIAREFELPVLLHVRRSQDALLKQLRRFRPPGGIAHAFNGSLQQAHAFLELGFVLGFGGAMTFERALQLRRLVVGLPADAHVLETDAPDIPPAWRPRERNDPAQLPRIASVFAGLRALDPATVAAQTTANALRVLPRLARAARGHGHP